MRINVESAFGQYCDVYLNDKLLDHVVEANDVTGVVTVFYKDASGGFVHKDNAERGAVLYGDLQVIDLRGNVRIEINIPITHLDRPLKYDFK